MHEAVALNPGCHPCRVCRVRWGPVVSLLSVRRLACSGPRAHPDHHGSPASDARSAFRVPRRSGALLYRVCPELGSHLTLLWACLIPASRPSSSGLHLDAGLGAVLALPRAGCHLRTPPLPDERSSHQKYPVARDAGPCSSHALRAGGLAARSSARSIHFHLALWVDQARPWGRQTLGAVIPTPCLDFAPEAALPSRGQHLFHGTYLVMHPGWASSPRSPLPLSRHVHLAVPQAPMSPWDPPVHGDRPLHPDLKIHENRLARERHQERQGRLDLEDLLVRPDH